MKTSAEIKLTSYSRASGCGCKISAPILHEVLKTKSTFNSPNLLVGNSGHDDAAVIDIGNNVCLIASTDFFTPIVDNPYDFGAISAANAISDIYAMGGKPILALAILAWPIEKLGIESAQQTLEGARYLCEQAGISIDGGHSIESSEPIFGLAVNGSVLKSSLKRNNTIKINNSLYLTKALGTGVYSTALKRGLLQAEEYNELVKSMSKLNSIGHELGKLKYVTAMTDITGFGLLGHLLEMLGEQSITAIIEKKSVATFNKVSEFTSQFVFPDNTTRNFNAYEKYSSGMQDLDFITYCDPQTSGGLLFSVENDRLFEFEKWLLENPCGATKIGETTHLREKKVVFI